MRTKEREWIASRLRKLRNNNGMDQVEIADYLGMKQQTYSAYEEARAQPTVFTIMRICELYQISIDDFMKNAPQEITKSFMKN